MSTILPFKRSRPAVIEPTPLDALPAAHAEVGQLWVESGPAGIWKVVEIKVVGENSFGRWPKIVRDIRIEPVGPRPEMSVRASAARDRVRWIREKNLLSHFQRPAEHAKAMAELRAAIPRESHAFFGLDEAKGGELLGARPEDARPTSTRRSTSYFGIGHGKGAIVLRMAPDGRMGIEREETLPLMPAATWRAIVAAIRSVGQGAKVQFSAGGFGGAVARFPGKVAIEVRGRRVTMSTQIAGELVEYVEQGESPPAAVELVVVT